MLWTHTHWGGVTVSGLLLCCSVPSVDNSWDNGTGISKGLLLWFHLSPLQQLFLSCLPVSAPPSHFSQTQLWPWLLLQSHRSQRWVCCDQGCAIWPLSSHSGLRGHNFNMENPLKGPMQTWTQTQLISLNFVPTSFDNCLFPKSKSKVPNVPPYLYIWDEGSKHLRGFVSHFAQCPSPTSPPWPSTEQRHKLCFTYQWLFLLSQQKHQQRCSYLHLLASQTFPMLYHSQMIFPL